MKPKALMNRYAAMQFMPLLLCLLAALGCQSSERATLHEDDHHQPEHWPSHLADAAEKLEQGLSSFAKCDPSSGEAAKSYSQLRDILAGYPKSQRIADWPKRSGCPSMTHPKP